MSLDEARQRIDVIDQQLIRLLNDRAELVHTIGEIKRLQGLEVYVPGREEMLLRKLAEINQSLNGRLTERAIRSIYREIMSAALALESGMRIAYLGPAGSWTHQVAINKFGNSVSYQPEASIESVFERVASREAGYGVLPIEHSAEGAVHHTLDHLAESSLQVYAEIHWRAETVLMTADPGAELQVIHGHPQLLAKCRPWLAGRFPDATLAECPGSGQAAALAAENPGHAALGTPLSAELHHLRVVATSPPEHASVARFIILGCRSGAPTGNDNTMLMVHSPDQVGALLKILQTFAEREVNVRQIENRPIHSAVRPRQDEARFFLEISGHSEDPPISAAIASLRAQSCSVKILGSYPAPTWVEEL
jgi:chorismate mutase/prephenate dehydratase